MAAEGWQITLLGGLSVRCGTQTLTRFEMRRAGVLLARLALFPQRSHPREELLELLWPDEDTYTARSRFRQVLTSLRQSLDTLGSSCADLLVADRTQVQLASSLFTTDVGAFEAALKEASRAATPEERAAALTAATGLYTGELLPGFYDDWVLTERQRLAYEAVSALSRLANTIAEIGDTDRAIEYGRRAVAADPLREDVQIDLIRLYAAAGQISHALRQCQDAEQVLWKELRALPSPELQALAESLRKPSARVPVPVPSGHETIPHITTEKEAWEEIPRLPVPLTRFFGREDEIAQLTQMLRPTPDAAGTRLLTLMGPGGSGKTRLALEVARRFEDMDSCAVWFVPLDAVTDSNRIVDTIAEIVCPLARQRTDPEVQIIEVLRRRPALLVLDNFEQLMDGGPAVVRRLLERSPKLRCVVTSRFPLGIGGEQEYSVPPLATPEIGDIAAEQVSDYPSIRLFLDRARMVRSDFALTANNTAPVVALCRRLEGIPLAIELAASWTAVLSPTQIMERLSDRLDLLVSSRSDVPERHRSLWATLEWSYRLLAPELQRFFACLSVFRGGWTLEAVEAVGESDASDAKLAPDHALSLLTQLRRHALVQVEETGDVLRFRMLEPVREFAQEQLSPEAACLLRRHHAHYFGELARNAAPHFIGPNQIEWLDRLQAEQDNFRAALAWAGSTEGDTELGLHLAASLAGLWQVRGYHLEGQRWLSELLAKAGEDHSAARAEALAARGNLGGIREEFAPSVSFLTESLALFRRLGDRPNIGQALCSLGVNIRDLGDDASARPLFEEALTIFQELGDNFGIARALGALAALAVAEKDYRTGYALLEKSAAFYRLCGHKRGMAWCIQTRGHFAQLEGNYDLAYSSCQDALPLFRALKDSMWVIYTLYCMGEICQVTGPDTLCEEHCRDGLAVARSAATPQWEMRFLLWLGDIAFARQDLVEARQRYREALALSERTGSLPGTYSTLRRLAGLAAAGGDRERAICLFASAASGPEITMPIVPSAAPPVPPIAPDDSEIDVRARLRGAAMSREEASAYAIADQT